MKSKVQPLEMVMVWGCECPLGKQFQFKGSRETGRQGKTEGEAETLDDTTVQTACSAKV